MRHTLRIFRKDVRHLWPRIAIFWALLGLFAWQDATVSAMFQNILNFLLTGPLLLACWFLIVSVMQQESLPGDRQYWLTRPFPRSSLLWAKALFLLAFLQLPVMLSQSIGLAVNGVSPFTFVPQLLGKQVLFAAVMVLPAISLAAVTRNIKQFALGALGYALLCVIPLSFDVGDWASLEPVRTWALTLLAFGLAAAILTLQYGDRRTMASRVILFCGALSILMAPLAPLPPGAAVLASWFSPHPAEERGIHIAFDPQNLPKSVPRYTGTSDTGQLEIQVPVQLTGIPAGWNVEGDSVQVEVQATDGQRWHSSWQVRSLAVPADGHSQATVPVARAFWAREQKSPVHLHARFAFTLIAPAQISFLRTEPARPEQIFEATRKFPHLQNMGPCTALQMEKMVMAGCRSPLHHPASAVLRLLSLDSSSAPVADVYWRGAETGFSAWQYASLNRQSPNMPLELQLEIRETASHFVRDLDIPDLHLDRCPINLSIDVKAPSAGWDPF